MVQNYKLLTKKQIRTLISLIPLIFADFFGLVKRLIQPPLESVLDLVFVFVPQPNPLLELPSGTEGSFWVGGCALASSSLHASLAKLISPSLSKCLLTYNPRPEAPYITYQ